MSIIIHKSQLIEFTEVSCDSEETLNSLKLNLINNYEFELKNEWLAIVDGNVRFFASFEKIDEDLLDVELPLEEEKDDED